MCAKQRTNIKPQDWTELPGTVAEYLSWNVIHCAYRPAKLILWALLFPCQQILLRCRIAPGSQYAGMSKQEHHGPIHNATGLSCSAPPWHMPLYSRTYMYERISILPFEIAFVELDGTPSHISLCFGLPTCWTCYNSVERSPGAKSKYIHWISITSGVYSSFCRPPDRNRPLLLWGYIGSLLSRSR